MRNTAVFLGLALSLSMSFASGEAFARKPQRVLGCSSSDLNSFGGSQCVKRGENDILNGSGSVHVAVCSGGHVYCCITQNGSTSGGRCVDVSDRHSTIISTRSIGNTPSRNSGGSTSSGGGLQSLPPSSHPTKGNGCPGGVC